MKNHYQKLFATTLILLFSACSTTYGPISEDNFQDTFLAGVEDRQQNILFYSRAIWYPNKNGFKFLPAGKKSRKGVIVCTDQGIYFSEWNASGNQYNAALSATYDKIEVVRYATNEILGRLVVKKGNFNSFEILGETDRPPYLPNKEQTEIAYKIIQQQAKS